MLHVYFEDFSLLIHDYSTVFLLCFVDHKEMGVSITEGNPAGLTRGIVKM